MWKENPFAYTECLETTAPIRQADTCSLDHAIESCVLPPFGRSLIRVAASHTPSGWTGHCYLASGGSLQQSSLTSGYS